MTAGSEFLAIYWKDRMIKASYKIGEVAKLSAVGIETIRFYERNGLIDEPPRRPSGYREYSKDTVVRLRFIRRAKDLGFSLKEIGSLLSLRGTNNLKCGSVKQKAEAKIADIDQKINDLQNVRAALIKLSKNCKTPASGDCPIVISLDGKSDD